jgi:hypothetical protein
LNELQETLRSYRAGQIDRATALARFVADGWDVGDADALLNNTNYTPAGDPTQQFIDQQARKRQRQSNPLLRT